jgi:hypothetical protein
MFSHPVAWQNRRVLDVPLTAAFEPARRVASDDTRSIPPAAWASASARNSQANGGHTAWPDARQPALTRLA